MLADEHRFRSEEGMYEQLANDLGATGTFDSGEAACKAAIKAMGDVKAKMGERSPSSSTSSRRSAMRRWTRCADCAGHCDATHQAGRGEGRVRAGQALGHLQRPVLRLLQSQRRCQVRRRVLGDVRRRHEGLVRRQVQRQVRRQSVERRDLRRHLRREVRRADPGELQRELRRELQAEGVGLVQRHVQRRAAPRRCRRRSATAR